MKTSIKSNPTVKRTYPQLFRGKCTGNIYLYPYSRRSITVHLGPFNGKGYNVKRSLGQSNLNGKEAYDNPDLEIFEGTVELTNP